MLSLFQLNLSTGFPLKEQVTAVCFNSRLHLKEYAHSHQITELASAALIDFREVPSDHSSKSAVIILSSSLFVLLS